MASPSIDRAPYLRLVHSWPPPRPRRRRYLMRISLATPRAPIGLGRTFWLTEDDIAELIAVAAVKEGRAQR